MSGKPKFNLLKFKNIGWVGLFAVSILLVLSFQNADILPGTTPEELTEEQRQSLSCSVLRQHYGLKDDKTATVGKDNFNILNSINFSALQTTDLNPPLSCSEFESLLQSQAVSRDGGRVLTLKKSLVISPAAGEAPCRFLNTGLVIAQSHILFDGGGSTFTGNKRGQRMFEGLPYGIRFEQNEDPKKSAAKMTPIRNVVIRNATFMNYSQAGLLIQDRFNRSISNDALFYNQILYGDFFAKGKWDDYFGSKPNKIDTEIRSRTPQRIAIRNIKLRNTLIAGIYIQSMVTKVDIDGVDIRRTGGTALYYDQGSREILLRNSCIVESGFYYRKASGGHKVGSKRKSGGREGLAIDASAGNRVSSNLFLYDRGGGVHLYKNSWEGSSHNPYGKSNTCTNPNGKPYPNAQFKANTYVTMFRETNSGCKEGTVLAQFPRMQMSAGNVIENNVIVGGFVGVALARRQYALKPRAGDLNGDPHVGVITTPQYDDDVRGDFVRADYAPRNIVRNNRFIGVKTGVMLLDHSNQVIGNTFEMSPSDPCLTDSTQACAVKYVIRTSTPYDSSSVKFTSRSPSLAGVSVVDNVAYEYKAKDSHPPERWFNLLPETAGSIRQWSNNKIDETSVAITSRLFNFPSCELPVFAGAVNSSSEVCTMGAVSLSELEHGQRAHLENLSGSARGQAEVVCVAGTVRVLQSSSSFCCVGASCEKKARGLRSSDLYFEDDES